MTEKEQTARQQIREWMRTDQEHSAAIDLPASYHWPRLDIKPETP